MYSTSLSLHQAISSSMLLNSYHVCDGNWHTLNKAAEKWLMLNQDWDSRQFQHIKLNNNKSMNSLKIDQINKLKKHWRFNETVNLWIRPLNKSTIRTQNKTQETLSSLQDALLIGLILEHHLGLQDVHKSCISFKSLRPSVCLTDFS